MTVETHESNRSQAPRSDAQAFLRSEAKVLPRREAKSSNREWGWEIDTVCALLVLAWLVGLVRLIQYWA